MPCVRKVADRIDSEQPSMPLEVLRSALLLRAVSSDTHEAEQGHRRRLHPACESACGGPALSERSPVHNAKHKGDDGPSSRSTAESVSSVRGWSVVTDQSFGQSAQSSTTLSSRLVVHFAPARGRCQQPHGVQQGPASAVRPSGAAFIPAAARVFLPLPYRRRRFSVHMPERPRLRQARRSTRPARQQG